MIHIIQVLCPSRHCIAASIYDPAERTDAEALAVLQGAVEQMILAGELNPWCGICNSRKWSYEDRVTRFATKDEAMPLVLQLAQEQARTRAILGNKN